MINKKTNKGFTLIELLVVISIIGVLASIVLAALTSTKVKASDAKKISTVRQVDTALKLYESNVGSAPGNFLGLYGVSYDALPPEAAIIACEDASNPNSASNQAYVKSMQQLLDAGVYPEIPRSADGNSYCYFDYGGLFAEGALFTAKLAKGDKWTTSPTGVPEGGQPPVTPSFAATGGTVAEAGGKRIHTFRSTSDGPFVVSAGRADVEVLVVAGGGGGGGSMGGGGGGGGIVPATIDVTPGSYSVSVGNGGLGGSRSGNSSRLGQNGGNSSFDTSVTALGGGGGGYADTGTGSYVGGNNGGSGGGGGSFATNGSGTSGQGYNGGSSGFWAAGGGGGGGAVGGPASANNRPGNGGAGVQSSITGIPTYYGGGGGGGGSGSNFCSPWSTGGSGGGGYGVCNFNGYGGNGSQNTGGGGGGGGGGGATSGFGGNGGSGIVIISYTIPN